MALRTVVLLSCVVSTLAACAPRVTSSPPPQDPGPAAPLQAGPVDGQACAGAVDPPPAGAEPLRDAKVAEDMFQKALAASDKGGLCTARAFTATAPITVYRVWNSEKDYTQLGVWWSFAPPAGTRDRYRQDNAVCEEWSLLDRLEVCTIKIGAHFLIGPGQSAACNSGGYPKSAVNQVFIANDARAGQVLVENCEQRGEWPATAGP